MCYMFSTYSPTAETLKLHLPVHDFRSNKTHIARVLGFVTLKVYSWGFPEPRDL